VVHFLPADIVSLLAERCSSLEGNAQSERAVRLWRLDFPSSVSSLAVNLIALCSHPIMFVCQIVALMTATLSAMELIGSTEPCIGATPSVLRLIDRWMQFMYVLAITKQRGTFFAHSFLQY
jgi:hypothetical protein